MEIKYGMRSRGFSIGCQPMDGLIRREDDIKGKFYDIIVYNRELTDDETRHYQLTKVED